MRFLSPEQYQPQCYQTFLHYLDTLASLLPFARIEHIGSSAIQGAISKGDLDILVAVDASRHAESVSRLERYGFSVSATNVMTRDLCTLDSDSSDGVTIQLIAAGSKYECFARFRDCMNSNPDLVEEFNRLKAECDGGREHIYRRRKAEFISQVLLQCDRSKNQWQKLAMAEHYYGSCLCGGVTFEVLGKIESVLHCHCSMCQKAHSSAFASFGICDKGAFHMLSGQEMVKAYRSSEKVTRSFCGRCGASLLWKHDEHDTDKVSFSIALLDTPFNSPHQQHIFYASRAGWLTHEEKCPKHDKLPV